MHRSSFFFLFAACTTLLSAACSDGDIAVGKTEQKLQTREDGQPTGDGTTCSWEGTAVYEATTSDRSANPPVRYEVGSAFDALDGCNHCTCTAEGISCTTRECQRPGNGECTAEAMVCPDGSTVGRTGPNCEFAPCPPAETACTTDVKECPDGSFVGRTGPNCEFAPCP